MPQQAQKEEIKAGRRGTTDYNDFVLITGQSNPQLAKKIAKILNKEIYEPVSVFSDGEIRVKIPPNLRRRHVFIIQSTSHPVNKSIMELLFMIDAAKRASAQEITAVIPYFGYARQDRKEAPRVPISSSVVARMIEHAGANHILTIDVHSAQQQGFVSIPWDNLYGSYALLPAIKAEKSKSLVIASPDKGGMSRATGFAKLLNAQGVAIVYKNRDVVLNNVSEALEMIGDVKGKDVLLVDDMIDTAGTIANAANLLKHRGAKRVRAATIHGIFSGPALQRLKDSAVDEVIVSDTIQLPKSVLENKKITVVSVASLIAEGIKRIESGESLSKDLIL